MAKKIPLCPRHPERICWGCEKYCPVSDMGCGNGSERTMHPAEMLGEDWYLDEAWGIDPESAEDGGAAMPSGTNGRKPS